MRTYRIAAIPGDGVGTEVIEAGLEVLAVCAERDGGFAIEVERFEPHGAGWEPIEHQALLAYRWWTVDELDATGDVVYPREMADVLRAVLAGDVTDPLELSGT